jgi:hypothetical protein
MRRDKKMQRKALRDTLSLMREYNIAASDHLINVSQRLNYRQRYATWYWRQTEVNHANACHDGVVGCDGSCASYC